MGTPITYLSGGTMGYQSGVFKNATTALGFTFPLTSGYRWWNGVDTSSSQYLLYSDIHSVGQSTVANGRPTAWSTPDLTDQSLLNLINTLPERVGKGLFTSVYAALDWLQSTGTYFLIRNGLENIVQSNLLNYYDAGWYTSYAGTGTSWSDLSGNNRTATLNNGVTFNSSGVGTFVFDGANDYAQTTGGNFTNQATMSCWFRTTTTQTNTYLMAMAKNIGSGNNGIDLLFNPTEVGGYWVATSGSFAYITYSTSYADNQWHMFTIAADGSNLRLYYDGILRTTLSLSGTLDIEATRRLTIGSWANGGSNAFASIPIAQLYSVGLSAEQVYQNYNTQKGRFGITSPVQNGMVLELDAANPTSYPGTGTAWTDISGYANNGTLTNGPTFSSSNGGNFSFDGADDYVDCGSNSSLNLGAMTISAWVKPTTNVSNFRMIIADESQGGIPWNYRLYLTQGGGILVYDIFGSQYSSISSTYAINDNNWHHVAGVRNSVNGQMALYIDGVLNGTATDSSGRSTLGKAVFVGASPLSNFSYPFSGNISVAQIYNEGLSAAQIQQNFYAYADRYGVGIVRNGLVLNVDAGNFASYPTSGTTWYDISGNVNDGVLTNGPTYSSNDGGIISLDGTNDYCNFSTGGLPYGSSPSTLCGWCKMNNTSGYGWIVSYGTGAVSQSRFIGTIGTTYYVGGYGDDITAGGVVANTWFHMVGVFTGSQALMYINGSLVAGPTNKSWNTVESTAQIGRQTNGGEYLNGFIGGVQIYNRALSASEILQNYNADKGRYGL